MGGGKTRKSCGTLRTFVGIKPTIDNDLYIYGTWRFQENDSPFNFDAITLSNGSRTTVSGNIQLTANNLVIDGSSIFTLSGNTNLTINNLGFFAQTLEKSGREIHNNSIRTFLATSLKYASPAKWSQRQPFQHRAGCKASQK